MSEMPGDGTDGAPIPGPTKRPRFVHQSLEPGCFRLLKIPRTWTGEMVCQLQHFHINDPPEYYAFSYVWGDGEQDHSITIHDTPFEVSRHLFEAIHAFSSRIATAYDEGYVEPVWIWIDAVCIDQSNLQEKAIQVPLMGEIYRSARMVLIYFGRMQGPDLTAYRIFRWLNNYNFKIQGGVASKEDLEGLSARSAECEELLAKSGISRSSLEALYGVIVGCITKYPEEDARIEGLIDAFRKSDLGSHLFSRNSGTWLHLLEFLNNSWFFRIWTIQEVNLAKAAALFAEEDYLPWDFVISVRGALWNGRASTGRLYSQQMIFALPEPAPISIRQSSTQKRFETRQDLRMLLGGIRNHKAKVCKDYIYGILSLLGQEIQSEITIDYTDSTPTELVFRQALMAACKGNDGSQFWSGIMNHYSAVAREVPELPSWVPDFSGQPFLGGDIDYSWGPTLSEPFHSRYDHLAHIQFVENSKTVTVRGICVDRVESATTMSRDIAQRELVRIYHDISVALKERDGLGIKQDDSQLLLGEEQYKWLHEMDIVFPENSEDSENLPVWVTTFLRKDNVLSLDAYRDLRLYINLIHNSGQKTFAEAQRLLDMFGVSGDRRRIVQMTFGMWKILRDTARRYLFRTAGGRVGYAPRLVTPGDAICVIPGMSSHLHVLSSDKKTHVTGRVSVLGLMNDELVDALPTDEKEWEEFELH